MHQGWGCFRRVMLFGAVATIIAAGVVPTASADPRPTILPAALPRSTGLAFPVAQITGVGDINDTPGRFSVYGTDLGIPWDNGRGEILTAFGDTARFDAEKLLRGRLYTFRSNVVLTSHDRNLANGMTIDGGIMSGPRYAKQILVPDYRVERTILPTAGMSIDGTQYLTYMSVKSWGGPGQWVTNSAGIAVSGDNGRNWSRPANTIRPNVGGDHNFQMSALLKVGDTVYVYGTPSGRFGAVRLARVAAKSFTDLAAYEYFSAGKWVRGNPDVATPVISGPTGEMSVAYNDYLGRYVALSTTDTVVMRTAPSPVGPWSPPIRLLKRNEINSAYAPYIHPWSTGRDLYFTMSIFGIYNVVLMRLPLDRVR